MSERISYYIASGLGNVAEVKKLKKILDDAGWRHTYDWTVHGAVWARGKDALKDTASDESVGVFEADVVIVLLPGGRGTHAELGMAIGKLDLASYFYLKGLLVENPITNHRVVVFSPDPEKDFGTNKTTCAFYHHPYVELFSTMDEMLDSLLGTDKS